MYVVIIIIKYTRMERKTNTNVQIGDKLMFHVDYFISIFYEFFKQFTNMIFILI